jgi:hypothetical protein
MIEKKYFELINKEIDGTNSKAESAKLKVYLSRNPEGRQLYEDLLKTANALKCVEEVEPPKHLKQHILNSLEFPQRSPKREWSILHQVIERFRLRSTPRYAVVFVSGICVGILLFVLFSQPRSLGDQETAQVSGTLALVPQLLTFHASDSVAINLDEVTGTLRTFFSNDIVLAELRLQSNVSVRTEISFRDLTFSGFKKLAGGEESLDVGQNRIALTHSGTGRYFLSFVGQGTAEGPLEARIYTGSRLLYQKTLQTKGADSER